MKERKLITPRDEAQKRLEEAGHGGFVEDFIEEGSDDLKFMAMNEEAQELWLKIVESYPSLLDDLSSPFEPE